MNTTNNNLVELSTTEQREISGGFIFMAVVLLAPLAVAAYRGWNDYQE